MTRFGGFPVQFAARAGVMPGMATVAWLFRFDGRVTAPQYLRWGLGLAMAKLAIDFVLCRLVLYVEWSPLIYVLAMPSSTLLRGEGVVAAMCLALVSVPFCWVGVAMTLRRLRDTAMNPWLCVLFGVPIVNLFLFTLLAVVPGAREPRAPSRTQPSPLHWTAAGTVPAAIALVATAAQVLLAVSVLRDYGAVLFIGVPFVQGVVVGALTRPRRISDAMWQLALSAAGTMTFLLLFGFEGIACVVMATPIWALLGAVGALTGRAMRADVWRHVTPALLIVPVSQMAAPSLAPAPAVFDVTTEVHVRASPQEVWDQLVSFGEIAPPTELAFRAGIAYPVRATIEGSGVGAIRSCSFNTGDFVEPIEVWDEPRLLRFSVLECPQPMIEWNPFHDHVDAPHLHGFFAAKRGQFELVARSDGTTLLRGTTWYSHGLHPEGYWMLWSNWLVHSIHRRVLEHIRERAER